MKGRHVVQYTNLSQLCLQQTGQCNERETYDCKKIVCIHVLLNLKSPTTWRTSSRLVHLAFGGKDR